MTESHLVVDGSNIATEGRSEPSLAQLDEAVRAFLAEHSFDNVVVVVDATFPNRIDPSERDEYEEAVRAGEILVPPAGTVGRGDAFVLMIAERSGATVLSNDSFQEFHPDHPWLFEEGRLLGGKPVPGVGWVFVDRTPVKGAKSRRATAEAKRKKSSGAKSTSKRSTSKRSGSGRSPAKPGTKTKKGTPATSDSDSAEPSGRAKAPAKRSRSGHIFPLEGRRTDDASALRPFQKRHQIRQFLRRERLDHSQRHQRCRRRADLLDVVPRDVQRLHGVET